MRDLTLDNVGSDDMYDLYNCLEECKRGCSESVRYSVKKWKDLLASTYKKCYNNNKKYTIVFKGQDAEILAHVLNNWNMKDKSYNMIALRIVKTMGINK